MIETGEGTRAALDEIQIRTSWTEGRMAEKIGVTRATIGRIRDGSIKNPRMSSMMMIETVLKRLRRAQKSAE